MYAYVDGETPISAGVYFFYVLAEDLRQIRVPVLGGLAEYLHDVLRIDGSAARLEEFYQLMPEGVYYKINGLMDTRNARDHGLRPMDADTLDAEIRLWVERHTELRGRVVYVPDKSAVRQYDKIKFY